MAGQRYFPDRPRPITVRVSSATHRGTHDPIGWVLPLGRYDRERWIRTWQELFDSHDLIHNKRRIVRVLVSEQRDGGVAVVDVDTLWRKRNTDEAFHWKGRACKVYTKVDARWLFLFQTGLLEY
jgi:hypothetical protein